MGKNGIVGICVASGIAFGIGCGAGAERQRPRGEPGPVRIAGPAEPAEDRGSGVEIAGEPGAAEIRAEAVAKTAEPRNPRALELPIDGRYLGLGLPPADPARYRKWRQLGRIRVGQTHLSHAACSESAFDFFRRLISSLGTERIEPSSMRMRRTGLLLTLVPQFGQTPPMTFCHGASPCLHDGQTQGFLVCHSKPHFSHL